MNIKDYRLEIEGAMGLQEIHDDFSVCTLCSLHAFRINTPAGEGSSKSDIMIVAQAPGEKENLTGKLFVGPSGEILDELFAVNGVRRDDFYLTNLIKCFLPKSKRPAQEHIDTCSRYLDREIEYIRPKSIVTLGYYAAKYIYEKYTAGFLDKTDICDLIGKVHWAAGIKMLALQHPSAMMYKDTSKAAMVKDYHKLKILLENCKYYPFCPMGKFHDRGLISKEWTELFCRGDWEDCHRFRMEEKGMTLPDYILPDGRADRRLKNGPK